MQNHEQPGLLHIYTGDGKGKTTAAIGLAVRMCGAGRRVLFAQFLKGRPTAELLPMRQLGIEICRTSPVLKFIGEMDKAERAQCQKSCGQVFSAACNALSSGDYGLVVLDEVLDAVSSGMLEEAQLEQALLARAAQTEAVLTGRSPSERLCQMADYLSDIEAKKHPYGQGIAARQGIEF